MWDERLSEAEVRGQLAHGTQARRIKLMAKIMRDAHVSDVWKYLPPDDIVAHRDELFARPGWHKLLWVFQYNGWIAHGLLDAAPYTERGPVRLS